MHKDGKQDSEAERTVPAGRRTGEGRGRFALRLPEVRKGDLRFLIFHHQILKNCGIIRGLHEHH